MKKLYFVQIIILILFFSVHIVRAEELAGVIDGRIEAGVTGLHPPRHLVKQSIKLNLYQGARIKKGAVLLFEERKLDGIDAPSPGKIKTIYLPVKIKGAGYKTFYTTVEILIKNEQLNFGRAGFLMVSNKPEGLNFSGKIFEENLKDNSPHRFLFHHKNVGNLLLFARVRLKNFSLYPCKVHIISSLSGPGYSEMSCGHLAAVRYLVSWFIESGIIVKIQPEGELTLDQRAVRAGEIFSGIMQFTVFEGILPRLVLDTWGNPNEEIDIAREASLQRAHGVYAKPYFEENISHKAGDGYTFIFIGEKPYLNELTDGSPNHGNFGVFYYINLSLENPLETTEDINLYFVPRSGVARGTILIEDEIIETHAAQTSEQVFLKGYRLEPREKKEVNILTFPESGSNYPLYLLVRSKYVKRVE